MARSENREREEKEAKPNERRYRENADHTARLFHRALGPAGIYRLDGREHVVEGDMLHRRLVVSMGTPVQRAGCPKSSFPIFQSTASPNLTLVSRSTSSIPTRTAKLFTKAY